MEVPDGRSPTSNGEILLTHFIVSDDVERSWRFYTEVLGGTVVFKGADTGPVNVKLSNSWIVINAGGGPTDDKPAVTLKPPRSRPGQQFPQYPGERHRGRVQPNGVPGVRSS